MISWATTKSLLIFFGPWLIPRALGFVRSIRESNKNPAVAIRPVPPRVSWSLNVLFFAAAFFLAWSLPNFTPENIFQVTRLPLKASTTTLFEFLVARRPLTPEDELLQTKMTNLENRVTYLTFGPSALTLCTFCTPKSPATYLYYNIPTILFPHLVNTVILLCCTSSVLVGREGMRWRIESVLCGFVLAAGDVLMTATYDPIKNFQAAETNGPMDHFFWRQRLLRLLGIALLDALIGFALYLTSTNRWRPSPPSVASRVETATKQMEMVRHHLNILGILKNSILRDKELRAVMDQYWSRAVKESEVEKEDADVVSALNQVLETLPLEELQKRTNTLADELVGRLGE